MTTATINTDTAREARLRRMAKWQGLDLRKSRGNGMYSLVRVYRHDKLALDQVEAWLKENDRAEEERLKERANQLDFVLSKSRDGGYRLSPRGDRASGPSVSLVEVEAELTEFEGMCP